MQRRKGFTLIEVLIVVIIIAILAALIIPRFLAQPERAVVAEANQMLGAIVRAQNTCVDSGAAACAGGWLALSAGSANWRTIGMSEPASSPNFTYTCTLNTSCTATRLGAATGKYTGNTITVNTAGAWSTVTAAGKEAYTCPATGGCSV